ncbi:PD-(D/E)XK motif protein [Candidatus Bipolaricaulota bacterium]
MSARTTAGESTLWKRLVRLDGSVKQDGTTTYNAIALPEHESAYVAKNTEGLPVFLIETSFSRPAHEIRLRYLQVQHRISARIAATEACEIKTKQLSVLTCLSTDQETQRLFVESLRLALPRIAERRSAQAIAELVEHLSSLFSAATLSTPRPVSGLWAELFVISRAADPERAVRAWHDEGIEHFDFSEGQHRIEIKASRTIARKHRFSMEQLNPPDGACAHVLSIIAAPSAGGTSLGDLRAQCIDHVSGSTPLSAKVDRLCIEYLGSDWTSSLESCFDEEVAASSLELFDVRDVPRIEPPTPRGVSQVSFQSSLELARSLSMGEIEKGSLGELLFGSR